MFPSAWSLNSLWFHNTRSHLIHGTNTFTLTLYKGPLGGDKVTMLTHTYPHKHLRNSNIKVSICNQQAGSPLYVRPDVWSGDFASLESMVIYGTQCPYRDQVLLNNTKPTYTRSQIIHYMNIAPLRLPFIKNDDCAKKPLSTKWANHHASRF